MSLKKNKITIPASGEVKTISFSGNTVIFVEAPSVRRSENRPEFAFNDEGNDRQPIYNLGRVQADGNGQGTAFNKLVFFGSSDFQGSVITFYTTKECLGTYIPESEDIQPFAKQVNKTSSTTSEDTNSLEYILSDGSLPSEVTICANGTHVFLNHNAGENAVIDVGLKVKDQSIYSGSGAGSGENVITIQGIEAIENLSYISETDAVANGVTLTYWYY